MNCLHCKKDFIRNGNAQKYCMDCREIVYKRKSKARDLLNMDKIKQNRKEWYKNNKEYFVTYGKNNKDKMKKAMDKYKEKGKRTARLRRINNPLDYRKSGIKWKERNKDAFVISRRTAQKKYAENNLLKIKAQSIAKNIPKLDFCENCGIRDVKLERHHPDYNKPKSFLTLCINCHHKLHGRSVYVN